MKLSTGQNLAKRVWDYLLPYPSVQQLPHFHKLYQEIKRLMESPEAEDRKTVNAFLAALTTELLFIFQRDQNLATQYLRAILDVLPSNRLISKIFSILDKDILNQFLINTKADLQRIKREHPSQFFRTATFYLDRMTGISPETGTTNVDFTVPKLFLNTALSPDERKQLISILFQVGRKESVLAFLPAFPEKEQPELVKQVILPFFTRESLREGDADLDQLLQKYSLKFPQGVEILWQTRGIGEQVKEWKHLYNTLQEKGIRAFYEKLGEIDDPILQKHVIQKIFDIKDLYPQIQTWIAKDIENLGFQEDLHRDRVRNCEEKHIQDLSKYTIGQIQKIIKVREQDKCLDTSLKEWIDGKLISVQDLNDIYVKQDGSCVLLTDFLRKEVFQNLVHQRSVIVLLENPAIIKGLTRFLESKKETLSMWILKYQEALKVATFLLGTSVLDREFPDQNPLFRRDILYNQVWEALTRIRKKVQPLIQLEKTKYMQLGQERDYKGKIEELEQEAKILKKQKDEMSIKFDDDLDNPALRQEFHALGMKLIALEGTINMLKRHQAQAAAQTEIGPLDLSAILEDDLGPYSHIQDFLFGKIRYHPTLLYEKQDEKESLSMKKQFIDQHWNILKPFIWNSCKKLNPHDWELAMEPLREKTEMIQNILRSKFKREEWITHPSKEFDRVHMLRNLQNCIRSMTVSDDTIEHLIYHNDLLDIPREKWATEWDTRIPGYCYSAKCLAREFWITIVDAGIGSTPELIERELAKKSIKQKDHGAIWQGDVMEFWLLYTTDDLRDRQRLINLILLNKELRRRIKDYRKIEIKSLQDPTLFPDPQHQPTDIIKYAKKHNDLIEKHLDLLKRFEALLTRFLTAPTEEEIGEAKAALDELTADEYFIKHIPESYRVVVGGSVDRELDFTRKFASFVFPLSEGDPRCGTK